MPKIAYTEEEKEQIRLSLIHTGLELMSRQGIKKIRRWNRFTRESGFQEPFSILSFRQKRI